MTATTTTNNSRLPRPQDTAPDPPQASQIRVALIGCGAIAEQMHLPVLAGHRVLKLSALVDRSRERAEKFAKGYGVATVLDDAAQLSREVVDAAIIATPPFHHAPCAIELMQKGIHVLVEKPMATNVADAERMVAEADRTGVVLSVGYFRRLYPSLRLMKALLESDWVGAPLGFHVEGGGMYNWAAATLGNMRREMAGGGALIDFGSHMVDLMFALFDEPAEVVEYCDNAIGGIESDCTIDVTVRRGGRPVPGRIEIARTRMLGNFIRVECERATLEFQMNERFRVKVTPRIANLIDPFSGQPREFFLDAAWQGEDENESWYATFGRQFDDWVGAIRTGREPVLSGRSALASARLIEACYTHRRQIREPWVWQGIRCRESGVGCREDKQLTATPRAFPLTPDTRPLTPHVAGHGGRILVTGANGFIGSRVVELLQLRDQRDVRALVHNPANASRLARLDVEMVQADLGSPTELERLVKDCESVLHCAIGTTWGERRKIVEVNVNGTRRLAEAALAVGVKRFVHVSTMAVYGNDNELTGTLDEQTPVRPTKGSVYGESKAVAEEVVQRLEQQGLSTVIFRPARVFGPFSNIFITRPLQAIAQGRFAWLGPPDVASDMVYVDNLIEALLLALSADSERVSGQVFNIGDADQTTWRQFYQYFAEHLHLDLLETPTESPRGTNGKSALRSALAFPSDVVRGIGQVVTSPEFKSLGRRVLSTAPIGTVPRRAIERFPALERGVRKVIKADDTLPIYRPAAAARGETVHMGSGGAVLSIKKLQDRVGFVPPVSRADALQLTLDWVRHARIV